jgi:hypothetical protein
LNNIPFVVLFGSFVSLTGSKVFPGFGKNAVITSVKLGLLKIIAISPYFSIDFAVKKMTSSTVVEVDTVYRRAK